MEKILIRIWDYDQSEADTIQYVKLTPSELKFLEWLLENSYLRVSICYEIIDELPKPTEF